MVVKTVKRKTSSKKSAKVAYIITAAFAYGPYKNKTDAETVRSRISGTNYVVTSRVKKGVRGYMFSSKTRIGATNIAMKNQAVATIRQHSPSAKVSIRKM